MPWIAACQPFTQCPEERVCTSAYIEREREREREIEIEIEIKIDRQTDR